MILQSFLLWQSLNKKNTIRQQQFIISFNVLTKHTYSLDSCTKHKQYVLRYLAGRKLSINEQTHIWNYINYTLYNNLKLKSPSFKKTKQKKLKTKWVFVFHFQIGKQHNQAYGYCYNATSQNMSWATNTFKLSISRYNITQIRWHLTEMIHRPDNACLQNT